ncbi:hypothetical protein [Leifsonia xyli]|uniref:hypothetical protein n=1 Tax=Leifsonia xyli TaxID=1575 RepID=UPI003D67FB54
MVSWSPIAHAQPAEWLLRVTESQPPYAVVRRFLKGDPNRPNEWFLVVTWAPASSGRELIGWVRSFDAAWALGWDYRCAFASWRHHQAASRADAAQMEQVRPAARDLVAFWREHGKAAYKPITTRAPDPSISTGSGALRTSRCVVRPQGLEP